MGLELRHLQEPKWGVLSKEDSSHPWVVGGGDGAGRVGTFCSVAISLDSSVYPQGVVRRGFFFFFLNAITYKIEHFNDL